MNATFCTAALLLVMAFGTSASAAQRREAPVEPGWNEAEFVFSGKLDHVTAGPVAHSLPPIYLNTLDMTVEKVLRGDLKAGDKIILSHSARQMEAPVYADGGSYLVSAKKLGNRMVIARLEEADAKKVQAVEQACKLPLGWKMEDGKAVSPWASLGKKAWAGPAPKDALVCSQSGRPALLAGGAATFEVEKVPPKQEIQWTNPDGDGEYKITVTNTTDKPLVVPALLSNDKGIVWDNSLAILCQGKPYVCPGFKTDAGELRATTLKPKESVSTTVNALRLDGPEWPRGGYRIEFQFCLGEKSQTMSFYYMARHHDLIRDALGEKK